MSNFVKILVKARTTPGGMNIKILNYFSKNFTGKSDKFKGAILFKTFKVCISFNVAYMGSNESAMYYALARLCKLALTV